MMESAQIVTSGKNIQISSSPGKLRILDVGGGNGSRARTTFPSCRIITIDKNASLRWDVDVRGLPNGDYDIIFANHVFEHLTKPDFFLEECKRIMKPYTILNIGTPNLAAWYNRILFLFGFVPNHVELSLKHNVGKPFNWGNVPLGGHIYVYTVPALIDLLKRNGFRIMSVEGEASTFPCHFLIRWLDKLLTKLTPNLASAFRIKCQYLP